jgi:hypothetical protein
LPELVTEALAPEDNGFDLGRASALVLIERKGEPLFNQGTQRFVLFVSQLPRANEQVVREIDGRLHFPTVFPSTHIVK